MKPYGQKLLYSSTHNKNAESECLVNLPIKLLFTPPSSPNFLHQSMIKPLVSLQHINRCAYQIR